MALLVLLGLDKKHQSEHFFPRSASEWQSAALDFVFDVVVIFFLVFFVIRPFFVAPFQVKQQSMEPTVHDGEYILVSKLPFNPYIGWKQYQRGDIVVFQPPTNQDIYLIKRVIGVGGDTIKITDGKVYLKNKDGVFEALPESYLPATSTDHTCVGDCTAGSKAKELIVEVPRDQYFVLGDNRTVSRDARTCFVAACDRESDRFLSSKEIAGSAWVTFWPLIEARALTK